MSVIDRIKQINQYKGISERQFCIEVGIANGYLDKVKDVGSEKLLKILNRYPEISPEWLLTGNGPMLKKDNHGKTDYSNIDNIGLIKDLIDKIGELSVQLGEQTKENEHLYQKNMELQSTINELKEGMGDRWNKSSRRDNVYSHPDIAAEPEE